MSKKITAAARLSCLAFAYRQACKLQNNDYDFDEALRQLKDLVADHKPVFADDFLRAVRGFREGADAGPIQKLAYRALSAESANATVSDLLAVMKDLLDEDEHLASATSDTVNTLRFHLARKLAPSDAPHPAIRPIRYASLDDLLTAAEAGEVRTAVENHHSFGDTPLSLTNLPALNAAGFSKGTLSACDRPAIAKRALRKLESFSASNPGVMFSL